jgi:iron complex outermembrane receptor protein
MSCRTLLKTIVLPVLLIISQFTYAQERTITGKVTDSKDGTPIARASVVEKGSNKGTTTAEDGTFKLTVGPSVTALVITSVGYGRMEVNISGQTSVSAALNAVNSNLNEVVVVGYGTRKVKDLTGSVASVTAKDFNKGVIASPEELFQGKTAGVNVTPASGEPGGSINIYIRGTNSIRPNNNPLFVVDGVPLDLNGTMGTSSGVEGSSTPKNPLMFINPNDIESITILKDASSAAIYGSRGANGVVLITTKSGRGKGSFTFSATTSVSKPASRYKLLSAQDFLLGVKKANLDAGTDLATATAAVTAIDKGYNTNWQDEIFQTAISQSYNLGWGFAKKNTTLRLSGSYDNQNGIVRTSNLQRATVRGNLSQKFAGDKLRLDATITYANLQNTYPPITNNAGYQGSLIGATITFNPTYPVIDPSTGLYFDPKDGNRNPVEMLRYFSDKDNANHVLSNVALSWKIIEGLVYKGTFGYDNSFTTRTAYADPRLSSNGFSGTTSYGINGVTIHDYGNTIYGNGRGYRQTNNLTTLITEHTLTYDKAIGDHQINAIAGLSYQNTTNYYSQPTGAWGLTTPVTNAKDVFVKGLGNFTNHITLPGDSSGYQMQSFFGRANYTYRDKYLLTATVRVDGSSKFAKSNKFGTFPAFAAKWRILNEDFAKSLSKVFNQLDLRLNYGKTGNQEFPAYASLAIRQNDYYFNTGYYILQQANPNLKWESVTTKGAGLDLAFLNSRVRLTTDYFYKSTSNFIYFQYVPGGFGPTTNQWINLPGNIINKGFEFGLDLQAFPKRNAKSFSWDINYNMSFLKNKVINFGSRVLNTGQVNGQGLSGAYAQTIQNGYSLFTWKMPIFAGFDGNGNQRFANGDPGDKLVGNALPTFNAGLTNSFSWKNWSANIFFNTVDGFYIYNNTANALFLKGSLKTAHNVTYAAADSPEDPINPGSVSTRFLEKGNFIRLSNASLSYSFNVKNNNTIKSLTATISGQNLWLITKYSGLDPEVNIDHGLNNLPSRGFDYAGYPKPRTVTLGINVGF